MKKRFVRMMLATWLLFCGCGGKDADLPARYRNLRVPENVLGSPTAREHGRALFVEHCAICHGIRADGRGIRKEGLDPPPRDFNNPEWRVTTSPRHIYFAIREGVSDTAMPSWKTLDERQSWDLVAYVLSVGEQIGR